MGMETLASSPPAEFYLDRLNDAQRRAVLHGDGQVADPLLIVAGAGTGKTNALAHRVGHLIVKGADPTRILAATFTRRAAKELTRRIERIVGEVLGDRAKSIIAGLTWAGTFHAIGTRLLREHAEAIGLRPDFTIYDREDSIDLMSLVRSRMKMADDDRRFPLARTCFDIYSRVVNGRTDLAMVLGAHFSWCEEFFDELKALPRTNSVREFKDDTWIKGRGD